jgi:hypothetical protein
VAALNDDFAQQIGLNASRDGLAKEDPRGRYANLIAVRTQDLDKPWQMHPPQHSPSVRHASGRDLPAPRRPKPRAQRIWLRQSASAAPWGEARSA